MDVTEAFIYEDGLLLINDHAIEVRREEIINFLVGLSFYEKWCDFNKEVEKLTKEACKEAQSTKDLIKKLGVYSDCELLSTPKCCIFGFKEDNGYCLVICTKLIIGYTTNIVNISQTDGTLDSAILSTINLLGDKL